MHIDFMHIMVFYFNPFESFNGFAYYIRNGFAYSDLSFVIFQLSLLYYYLAYLVSEMDTKHEAIIAECEKKLNHATVCFP